ncbi:MAG TPA: tripartite tricarboxylate transporter substrate binding protein [Xanthobacteraceae bacterium]|nr:tripartite tricarboxylate transporter substrate binding protein [Xanthobacteraceae bacterium]
MHSRCLTIVAALAAALCVACAAARAEEYPARTVKLVVGFAAGGTTDFMARLLADRMREPLGQPVVVENRTGANGAIGAEFVAKAAPDGYTLYFTTAGVATVYPHLKPAPYDPLKDFVGVSRVAFNATMLVVNAALPVHSARELAALAREKPGKITVAITGLGSVSHLGAELFQSAAGVKLTEVPYRGAAPAMTDLIGGQLDSLFGDGPTVMAQIGAGKIRPIAATSHQRSEIFPDVPTFLEQGFADAVADQWAGVLAPAGTPAAVVAKLNAAIVAVMHQAQVRAKLAQTGVVPGVDTPAEFATYLKEEYERWGRIIREKGIKAE